MQGAPVAIFCLSIAAIRVEHGASTAATP